MRARGVAASRLTFRPYAPGDVLRIAVRADMVSDWAAAGHSLPMGRRWIAETPDGEIIGVGGLIDDPATRTMDLWSLCGESLRPRHWVEIRRFVADRLKDAKREDPQRRIWAIAENPRAAAFLVQLGFQAGPEPGVYVV